MFQDKYSHFTIILDENSYDEVKSMKQLFDFLPAWDNIKGHGQAFIPCHITFNTSRLEIVITGIWEE